MSRRSLHPSGIQLPKPEPDTLGRVLINAGWAIALLYFPSGLLHEWMGSLVYLRDVLLILHFFVTLVFMGKQGRLHSFVAKSWVLLVIPLFLIPALFQADFRVEAGTVCKWVLLWLDWILIGRLAAQYFKWRTGTGILSALTAILLLADLLAGFHEWQTNTFLFPMKGEVSAFGVEMGKDQFLKKHARIKGFQRDVFSFANLMGMSAILGVCVGVSVRKPAIQVASGVWFLLFCWMLYTSGGRSAFFGVAAAVVLAIGMLSAREMVRKYYLRIALAWLVIGLFISFIGVGQLTEAISSSLMKGSHIGDSRSAYMRDDNWSDIKSAIAQVPIVLFTGSPLGSLIDGKVQTIFHWADNNYLWLVYHTGVMGLAAIIFYFYNVLARPLPFSREPGRDCLILFLLFVMGEAIARESLTFMGCMPLFVACGFVNGSRLASENSVRPKVTSEPSLVRQTRSTRKSGPSSKPSETESFAERIAKKSKQQPPPKP